jgi:hypothetical protein
MSEEVQTHEGWRPDPGGGGGSVISREVIVGDQVELTWDTSQGPDNLLDLTNPAEPVVIAAGVYSVAVTVTPDDNLTAGDQFEIDFTIADPLAPETPDMFTTSAPASTGLPRPKLGVTLVYYMRAGTSLVCQLGGAFSGSHDFSINPAVIQRLS